MDFIAMSKQHEGHIIALRRDFHAHPELSNQEERTALKVREELDQLGIPYAQLDEHCVVGKLVGGQAGPGSPRLAIRADMDALPVTEESGLPFKSSRDGVMHACGHDGHTAMLLGAAALLKAAQDRLRGTVYLCFQSAEEVSGGAQTILDHLEKEGGVDRAIAAHLWPQEASGSICVTPGTRMASADGIEIEVDGRGGHGSRPDLSLDPIKPLCQIALAISAVPVGRVSPLSPTVVHVGKIEGGPLGNIFPQSARLKGGLRAFSEDSREQARQAIRMMAEHIAQAYGVKARVDIRPDAPMVYNDPEACALAARVLARHPVFARAEYEPVCASENFGCFLKRYPGFMAFIGTRNEQQGLVHTLHHPKFGIDEQVLSKGAAFFALYADAFFEEAVSRN